MGDEIWIPSDLNKSREIYYKLKDPAPEYRRFHEGFLWVANLTKFFVNYLNFLDEQDELVTLQYFRARFFQYLVLKHGGEQCFQEWHQ